MCLFGQNYHLRGVLPHSILACLFCVTLYFYRVFHGFGQAKFPHGILVLGSTQFSLVPQLPQKMTLYLKVVKFN